MFMQDIRRATKKHRTVLLVVVIILMLGLVGSFATWNSAGQGGRNNFSGGDLTLEQQIAIYEEHISNLQKEFGNDTDYSGSLELARAYMDLSSLYADKYNADSKDIPVLDPPLFDEEGNEIPLSPEEEAERAVAETERDAAMLALDAWREAAMNAAMQAERYYQLALDHAPEGFNNAGIADIKANQARACDIQEDYERALAYMEEAYELAPENINYLLAQAALQEELGNWEAASALNAKATEQRIATYLEYIAPLEEKAAAYADYLSLALAYIDLSYLYAERYKTESGNLPVLDAPELELDEDGNEIPLDEGQQAAQAAAEAEYETALAAAEIWNEATQNAAIKAEDYYQQALDNAPQDLEDTVISGIKAGQAATREVRGDMAGALAFMEEAHRLSPDEARFVNAMALLHQEMGNHAEAETYFKQAREIAPQDFEIAYSYAYFLVSEDGYEAGIAELTAYRDALPAGDANIEMAESYIESWQMWADLFASFSMGDEDDDEDDHEGHDHE